MNDETRDRWAAAADCPSCDATAGVLCTGHAYPEPPAEVIEAANGLDGPRAVAQLWQMLATEQEAGWSSNDFTQAVDDWFTEHGFPTILYA